MGAMDFVLNDIENAFGMSETKASTLLSSFLSYINEQGAGLKDLLDRFRQVGLGDTVSTWLKGGSKPISAENVESALGSNTISTFASKAGLSIGTTASALALMLPKLVQRLAPGGEVPTRLPSEFASYLSGTKAVAVTGARQAAYAARDTVDRTRSGNWLGPILAAIGVVIFGLWLWGRHDRNIAFNAEEQVQAGMQRASAALGALKPGFSAQDLASALNLSVINFASGSAEIPQSSENFLAKAAAIIKMAPAGTVMEIGGHTDSAGDADANLRLSEQRAEAVRSYLVSQGVEPSMLTARGYGATKPIASNDTEEGKFRNRRIEFRPTAAG